MLETCGEASKFSIYDFPFDGYYPSYTYKADTSNPDTDTYDTFISVAEANGLRREAILRIKSEQHANTSQAIDIYEADPTAAVTAERLTAYFVEEYQLDAVGEDGSPL